MNIFAVDHDPFIAAQCLVDRHVVKMILETAQLLSTAHRVLDGLEYSTTSPKSGRKIRAWKLPDERDKILYQATHILHPSAVWCRTTNNNYNWLYAHFCGLLNEYTYRYGKTHKCQSFGEILANPPNNIPIGYLTPVLLAMPDFFMNESDHVESYRRYYKMGKKHLHKWTKRRPPNWIFE